MILYIGNKLSKYDNTPTSVETLGALLSEKYTIIAVSDKNNKLLRLLDMVCSIVRYRKNIFFVLIDTYSTSNFYYAYICAVVSKYVGVKYIPILHGGSLPDRLQNNPKLSSVLFGNACVNIAPSKYLVRIFQKYSFSTQLIPNYIDIDHYQYLERNKVQPNLLFVRAFSRLYNPKLAIETLNELIKDYPDTKLCMVGPDKDGTLAKVKLLVNQYGLQESVSFPGKLSKKEWIKLSTKYGIFINTTNVDNTPVSVLEAMALGLNIISTNVGGIPDLVDDGVDGVLVSPGSVVEMVNGVHYLLNNPHKAKKMTIKARSKVEKFSRENVLLEWESLLQTFK